MSKSFGVFAVFFFAIVACAFICISAYVIETHEGVMYMRGVIITLITSLGLATTCGFAISSVIKDVEKWNG